MNRENRYEVLKISDVSEALNAEEKEALIHITETVAAWRERNGKIPLSCVVVESDWPEYEFVWGMIEDRVTGETPPTFTMNLEQVDLVRQWFNALDDLKGPAYFEKHEYQMGYNITTFCGQRPSNDLSKNAGFPNAT
ncbi:hypothetical protein OAV22_02105 [Flavobacteriaceae bacterium]|nr:hypothetical protein [Flavobacteriaceae bacterium]